MCLFKRILIPTDGSEYTKTAIEKGVHLAKVCEAEVTALYVVDQTSFVNFPMDSTIVNVYSLLEKEGKEALDHVKNIGEEAGVKVKTRMEEGSPIRKITEASRDHDIVVMGTLGRTGMSKLLLGSVAERVVRLSHCPVMVVRAPEEK
ncbi:MAG: universal stress protein [Methanomassiliicoccales archaeon]